MMVVTWLLVAIAVLAAVIGPVSVSLALFLHGIRQWKAGGSRFPAVIGGAMLLFVIGCIGTMLLLPVDIYIHDTYFRVPF
jgi:ABC-type phosphate transport system permease subunit